MATYAETADIFCTDTDVTVTGEMLSFAVEKSMSVSINRAIKLTLIYDPKIKVYVGNAQGLEFQSDGPKKLADRNFR